MTSQATKIESFYARLLRARLKTHAGPAWAARLRENAFDCFEQLGFPTTDEEEWKYTNVSQLAKTEFESATFHHHLDRETVTPFTYPEAAASQLVFVNGVYAPEFSNTEGLPAGVVVTNLTQALADQVYEVEIREHFNRLIDHHANAFAALNTALFGDGAFVHIPQNVQVEAPIHLMFLTDASQPNSASFPRVLVTLGRDAAATVIESYHSLDDGGVYWTDPIAELFVDENARLTYYKIQREGNRAFHVASTGMRLMRGAILDCTTINLGAQLARHDIAVKLPQEGAECWIDGLYIVGDGQHTDTHSVIDHASPHCNSHQIYKGILDGKSRAVFNGKIFVRRDARLTDAKQTNKNLLLSREARVDTKPQLEIFNDDVKCTHGATVGQLDEEELFYLLSRGLHEPIARNLLTYGFAEEIVEKIKIDSIKAQLDEAILNRLHARLEV